jgi:hypothetical protein
MAAALPALMIGAAVAGIAGTAVSVVGQIQQGEQNAAAAEAQGQAAAQAAQANARIASEQASIAREQAAQERRRAAIDAENFSRQARRQQGTRVSAIGASGFQLSGSALDILHDAALSDEQTRLFIRMEGEDRARARLAGATIEDMTAAQFAQEAAAARQVGRFTAGHLRTSSRFAAAGTLLGGASDAFKAFAPPPRPMPTFSRT